MNNPVKDDNRVFELRRVQSAGHWREALLTLPDAHPLQSWTWSQFKSRWSWSSAALILVDKGKSKDEKPVAAALVLKRRLPRSPFSILYTPKGPILDPGDKTIATALLGQLEHHVRSEKAIFLKIDPDVVLGYGAEEWKPEAEGQGFRSLLIDRGWRFSDDQIQYRNTVEIDLKMTEDELLAGMKQKTRYNIRLAGRRGVKIRVGDPDDFEMLAKMYIETAARDGFAVRPEGYYHDAWGSFYKAGMARLLIAEYEGQPLGAVFLVRSDERAIYMYGASNDLERQRMPNYLLQWESIRWAREQGCRVYDFWGAPDEFEENDPLWGVWRFKSGFNGRVVRHIGAWDYPARPFWYWLYSAVIPKYLGFLRRFRDVGAG